MRKQLGQGGIQHSVSTCSSHQQLGLVSSEQATVIAVEVDWQVLITLTTLILLHAARQHCVAVNLTVSGIFPLHTRSLSQVKGAKAVHYKALCMSTARLGIPTARKQAGIVRVADDKQVPQVLLCCMNHVACDRCPGQTQQVYYTGNAPRVSHYQQTMKVCIERLRQQLMANQPVTGCLPAARYVLLLQPATCCS